MHRRGQRRRPCHCLIFCQVLWVAKDSAGEVVVLCKTTTSRYVRFCDSIAALARSLGRPLTWPQKWAGGGAVVGARAQAVAVARGGGGGAGADTAHPIFRPTSPCRCMPRDGGDRGANGDKHSDYNVT